LIKIKLKQICGIFILILRLAFNLSFKKSEMLSGVTFGENDDTQHFLEKVRLTFGFTLNGKHIYRTIMNFERFFRG